MRFDCRTYTCAVENVDIEILVSSESFLQNRCADYQKPFHTHVYYELLLSQAEGSGELVCRDGRIPLGVFDVAIIPPSCSHRTVIHDPESIISLGFLLKKRRTCGGGDKAAAFDAQLSSLLARAECFFATLLPHLASIGERLRVLSSDSSLLGRMEFCAAFLQLLSGVLKIAEGQAPRTVISQASSTAIVRERRLPVELASKINSVLANEFTTDITPEALSNQYYISVKQINRYVQSQYGMTFLQRRNELRLICAARLLCEGQDAVAAIARQVGFESVNSFYSAFEKRFGKTPTEYRREKQS